MDTLGIEPRASRMLSGCDTTTPRARLRASFGCFLARAGPRVRAGFVLAARGPWASALASAWLPRRNPMGFSAAGWGLGVSACRLAAPELPSCCFLRRWPQAGQRRVCGDSCPLRSCSFRPCARIWDLGLPRPFRACFRLASARRPARPFAVLPPRTLASSPRSLFQDCRARPPPGWICALARRLARYNTPHSRGVLRDVSRSVCRPVCLHGWN